VRQDREHHHHADRPIISIDNVPAGIKHHNVELGACGFHLAQHQIGIHHLEIDIGFASGIGADRGGG
jgi:hypothetical protein